MYLHKTKHLQELRRRARAGDPLLQPVLQVLLSQADTVLGKQPVTITRKTTIPPGGTRNDYVSMGTYWWPDPEKPDGLPYIRHDGHHNPDALGDRTTLSEMIKAVSILALAWFYSDDSRYSRCAMEWLKVFFVDADTRMNPHLRYGQGIPGRSEGRYIGTVDTLKLAVQLVDTLKTLEASNDWKGDTAQGLKSWFTDYLNWLVHDPMPAKAGDHGNNIANSYDLQVILFALFTGDKEIAERTIRAVPEKRISTQIQPSGQQPNETSRADALSYATGNALHFIDFLFLGDHFGLDLRPFTAPQGGSIRKAVEYLVPFWTGTATWPFSQLHKPGPLTGWQLLYRAAVAFEDPAFAKAAETMARLDPQAIRADPLNLLDGVPQGIFTTKNV